VKLNKVTEDIFEYQDFLTEEECQKVILMTEKYVEADPDYWKSISFYESYSASYPQDNEKMLEEVGLPPTWFSDVENRMRQAAADVAGVSSEKMSKISFHIQRWLPGAYAPKHSDNTSNEGVAGAFTRSRYAGFLYLNEDFDGGLLKFYADHGNNTFDVVPKTGSLWMFAGGFKNMHEVTLVKNGARYTLGSFWDDREESDYPQETRDQWAEELAKVRAYQKEESAEWKDLREKGLTKLPDGKEVPAAEVGR
jgi:Rps23 Pro-64 3,4-dihydroxylase Tpa1-like proline 4-hydroxylase